MTTYAASGINRSDPNNAMESDDKTDNATTVKDNNPASMDTGAADGTQSPNLEDVAYDVTIETDEQSGVDDVKSGEDSLNMQSNQFSFSEQLQSDADEHSFSSTHKRDAITKKGYAEKPSSGMWLERLERGNQHASQDLTNLNKLKPATERIKESRDASNAPRKKYKSKKRSEAIAKNRAIPSDVSSQSDFDKHGLSTSALTEREMQYGVGSTGAKQDVNNSLPTQVKTLFPSDNEKGKSTRK